MVDSNSPRRSSDGVRRTSRAAAAHHSIIALYGSSALWVCFAHYVGHAAFDIVKSGDGVSNNATHAPKVNLTSAEFNRCTW